MKFVSYAQNFEDAMLWRALKHVEAGLYVDVGAQDPLVDSVSKAFFDRGWRGVHIEPVPAYAEQLRQARPGDTVLQVALAERAGTLNLNLIADTGLSTAVDAYAERHEAEHGFAHQTIQVPMLTLRAALAWLEGQQVHWLKIDVEGLEERVLMGWDSHTLRPWIMLVEATVPNSCEADFAGWEPILLAAGYQFAYFDGLNRFYVADEHADLLDAFTSPPNVFDQVQLSGLASSELCRGLIATHQASVAALSEQAEAAIVAMRSEAEARFAAAQAAAAARLAEVQAVAAAQLADVQASIERHELQARMDQDRLRTLQHALGAERQLCEELQAQQLAQREYERLHAHIAWLQGEHLRAVDKAEELNQSSHKWWLTSNALTRQLDSLHASTSWKITAPVRRAVDLVRWTAALPPRTVRASLRQSKRLVRIPLRWAIANPAVKRGVLGLLRAAPGLERRMRYLALGSGLTVAPTVAVPTPTPAPAPAPATPMSTLDEQLARELSPRAARILSEIYQAIDAKVP